MHDQRSPAELEAQTDHAILSVLLGGGLWAVEEVAREIGDPLATTDGLARLYGAGLVHRVEGFVFATRPAVRAEQLSR